MKTLLIFNLLFSVPIVNTLPTKEKGSYCVMSMHDQTILDSDNTSHTQSVASISKIMSTIVAIENADIHEEVVIDDSIYEVDGSMLYLKVGEVYTLEDLLYGLMLRSGNDAAAMIAKSVGGSQEEFVSMMNKKAYELKMQSSLFRNPSGLDEKDGGNVSSSCDMAIIMSYAMQNKRFRKIVSSIGYSPRKDVYWKNKNRFLSEYKGATGGKTGYTKKARRTLVTTSKKASMEVVVVSLNIDDDFKQHATMHDFAYANYEEVLLVKKGNYVLQEGKIEVKKDITRTIGKGDLQNMQYSVQNIGKYIEIKNTYENKTKKVYVEVEDE